MHAISDGDDGGAGEGAGPGWHRRAGISLGAAKPLKCTSERAPAKGPKQVRDGGRNGGSEAPDENIYRVKGGVNVASLFLPGLCEIIFTLHNL